MGEVRRMRMMRCCCKQRPLGTMGRPLRWELFLLSSTIHSNPVDSEFRPWLLPFWVAKLCCLRFWRSSGPQIDDNTKIYKSWFSHDFCSFLSQKEGSPTLTKSCLWVLSTIKMELSYFLRPGSFSQFSVERKVAFCGSLAEFREKFPKLASWTFFDHETDGNCWELMGIDQTTFTEMEHQPGLEDDLHIVFYFYFFWFSFLPCWNCSGSKREMRMRNFTETRGGTVHPSPPWLQLKVLPGE